MPPVLPAPPQTKLRNRPLAKKYGISDMTLRRWKGDPEKNTPPPMVINDIEYNDVEAWDAWWKDRTVTRAQRAERSNRKNPNPNITKTKRHLAGKRPRDTVAA